MDNPVVPQQLNNLLTMSRRIMDELNEREPSAGHLVELYQDRALYLQQLNESLNHSDISYSEAEKKAVILPKLNELAALDEDIISRLDKLKHEKEQELNDLRQESRSIKSYRQNIRPKSKSFFISRELEG